MNLSIPIYMDYSATTPVDERVAEKMCSYLTRQGVFGNPASRSHEFGWKAEAAVEQARADVAQLINANPKEIIWTSGATESDNLAIKGAAHFYKKKGKHIVTLKTEHKAVLDTCRQLEREGYEVSYLDPEPNGLLDLEKFTAALRDDTIVVSIMHVNNEIGVIQDIAAIGEICRDRKIVFHVDAAQSAGKVEIDITRSMARRVLAHCMSVVNRAYAWRRRCMAAAMSAACVPAPCQRTRLSVWARPSGLHVKRWLQIMRVSGVCVTGSGTASATWKRFTSMVIWISVLPVT